MFEHHFGLRENPFAAGHHAKFVFPSPEHQEAIAHLRYGIENREPFVLITGEVGTGKTTALFDALGEWQSRVEVALITNSALTQNELLEEIALRFGVPISGQVSKPQILAHLERVLAAVYARGDRAILLLDEAQNLERELLEEIRLLSNLERDGTKLVQVFLVGQPELEAKLARAELRQLRQRITVHYRLQPLSAEDTERYIHHRIMVAGGQASSVFPSKACREVFRITHGIPREINTLCSQALLSAFVDDAHAVAPAHVTTAAAELEFQSVLDRATEELQEHQAQAMPAPPAGRRASDRGESAAPERAAGPREDIDIQMIEAWMAELSRSRQGEPAAPTPAAPPLPSSASATARAAQRPPATPAPATPAAATPAPTASTPAPTASAPAPTATTPANASAPRAAAPEPRTLAPVGAAPASAATDRSDAQKPSAPRKRDLAEEQRAALPPRLRAKLDEGIEEDLESFLPRSRGRGVLIAALAAVALVVTAIVLVRFGVIPGLPFGPAASHVPAVAPAPPVAALPTPADSTTHSAAADTAARATSQAAPAAGSATTAPVAAGNPSASGATASSGPIAGTTPAGKPVTGASGAAAGAAAASGAASSGGSSAPASKPAAPASAPASFALSVATYLNADRAEAERVKLAAAIGRPVTVQEGRDGGTSVYHLVLGGFESRTAAEDVASDLIQKGLVDEARVVPAPKLARR